MFFWTHDVPAEPGRRAVRFAVTGAALDLGGRSPDRARVERDRRAVAAAVGLDRAHLLFLRQVHGADVVVADGPWAGEPPPADGVVTARDDLALAALAADCVPVLLADRVAGVVAAAHCGRPGLLAGVAGAAVDAVLEAGGRPGDLEAVVGPSVCGRCYEVPAAMQREVAAVSPVSATVSWTGTPALDVAAGVVEQLTRRGVRVTWLPGCTRESTDLHSYRRDGTTARFAGVVRLLPEAAA